MRKLLLTLLTGIFVLTNNAQTVREELHENIFRMASNYMAYPGPQQKKLTPAPKGMKPFYISHYGRHGSRFHSKPSMYNAPYNVLVKADSLGKLTPLGRDVMHRLDIIRKDAENHWGDLTPLGAEQERQIAHRMFRNFPEAFRGHTSIDARSTGISRCVLSMENFLLELLRMNPHLNIHHNATHRDMGYLNLQDKQLFTKKFGKETMATYKDYAKRHKPDDRLKLLLFNDTTYIRNAKGLDDFVSQLCLIAAIMHNTELGKTISLMDLMTEEDVYRMWKIGNVYWYIGWGNYLGSEGHQPFSQRNLLKRIIHDADSCIAMPTTNVQLRFGHETVILPLVCLLDIDGFGYATDDLESLEDHGWVNYHVFPMACNLQFVFYRRHPQDSDVVFKVLLNENEASLPLPTDMAPYYKWSDFRKYYLQKLAVYEN